MSQGAVSLKIFPLLLRCSAESSRLSTTPRSIPSAAEPQCHQDHRAIGPKRAAEAGTGLTGPQHLGSAPSVLPGQPLGLLPPHGPQPQQQPQVGITTPRPGGRSCRLAVQLGNLTLLCSSFPRLFTRQSSWFEWRTAGGEPWNLAVQYRRPHVARSRPLPLSSADPGRLTHISPPASSCKWKVTSHCTLPLNILFMCPEKKKSRKIILGISCLWHMIINSSPHQNIPTSGAFTSCNLEKAICIVQNAFVRFPFCYISIAVSVLAVDLIYHS